MSRKGKVYWVDLPLDKTSHVQGGMRPCVVVSDDTILPNSDTLVVCPMSTKLDNFSFHPKVYMNSRFGQVLCDQITTVDEAQLGDYTGKLTAPEMSAVNTAVALVLGVGHGTI